MVFAHFREVGKMSWFANFSGSRQNIVFEYFHESWFMVFFLFHGFFLFRIKFCMYAPPKLADSSRRFLIIALEAEIWVPLGGWHGGPKITKNFFFQFWVFLVRSLILRCFKIDYRKKWPYLDVLVGFNLHYYPCSVTLAERNLVKTY